MANISPSEYTSLTDFYNEVDKFVKDPAAKSALKSLANSLPQLQSVGEATGSSTNTGVGVGVLSVVESGGTRNVGVGYNALNSLTSGDDNVAIGRQALMTATTAGANVAIGKDTLELLTTGFGNVAVGEEALENTTVGSWNIAIGEGTMENGDAGDRNVVVGTQSGKSIANSGSNCNNVLLGSFVGQVLSTGTDNVLLGDSVASVSLTTGSRNIIIGSGADVSAAGVDDELNIGDLITGSMASGSETISLNGLVTHDLDAGLTADSGSAQGGLPLTASYNVISTVATIGDSTTLPAAAAGLEVTIINNGANACDVFPASGDNLGAGVDTAASLAAGSNITYLAIDGTNWEVI